MLNNPIFKIYEVIRIFFGFYFNCFKISWQNLEILEQNEAKIEILFSNCLSLIIKITHVLSYCCMAANWASTLGFFGFFCHSLNSICLNTAPPSWKGGNNTRCISCKRAALYINLIQAPHCDNFHILFFSLNAAV